MGFRAKLARKKVKARRAAKMAREANAAMCIQRLLRCRRARLEVSRRRQVKHDKDEAIARFWEDAEQQQEQLDLRLR